MLRRCTDGNPMAHSFELESEDKKSKIYKCRNRGCEVMIRFLKKAQRWEVMK
jgi:hypothetical protein